MERRQTAYRSLLPLEGAVLADPEPIPLRLVRGCIAVPFTADVRAVASRDRLADAVKGAASLLHDAGDGTRANRVQIATAAGRGGPGRP